MKSRPGAFGIRRIVLALILAAAAVGFSAARAGAPRVLPEGQRPDDRRLGPLVDLNGYFPFTPCRTPAQWAQRSERLRRQILVATGLWPMPARPPLRPVVHGAVDRGGYTVEKVYFESFPGHYVTGSLYRPKGHVGRLPGVLCPHGHWGGGRFHDAGEAAVRKQIEAGAERFEVGGRHPIQARCVQLARMGCIVFNYDMVGYGDSQQLPHRPGIRPEMNSPEGWGYFSPQAEARMQNMMGLQTFNSVRALDFLSGLSDVDPKRLAVTGASGGGTQTFILAAVDPRPAVAFPAVMVSTAMQGGCTCENACYLRIGTSNVEIAALFAPKPLGMTAANDWTKEMPEKGFPELRQHYQMLGAPDNVMLKALLQFGHNYNYPSRQAMYGWMNRQLKLGLEEPIEEEDYQPLSKAEMSVWDEQHPQPPGGPEHERALLRRITEDSQRQLAEATPKDAASLAAFRKLVGGAVDVMIGRALPPSEAVTFEPAAEGPKQRKGYQISRGMLKYADRGEAVPLVILTPAEVSGQEKRTVVWVDPRGKQALLDEDGELATAVRKLLDSGVGVVGVDLFGQGEFTPDGKPLKRLPEDKLKLDSKGQPPYAGYVYGYNHPMFAQRVHDILSVVAFLRQGPEAGAIDLVGLGGAGRWVAAAGAQAGDAVDRTAADTAGFRFAALGDLYDADFLPGAVKYGDLPAMLALLAPHRLWLAGEGPKPPALVAAAYKAAGAEAKLTLHADKQSDAEAAAVEWLLR